MTYYLVGNGLPSTLTAERIKSVLDLARNQERLFKQELDAGAEPAWEQALPGGDLYERLRALLTTIEGQTAYEKARSGFEGAKSKRVGRVDLLRRLLASCMKEAPYESGDGERGESSRQRLMKSLAEQNLWGRMAEAVWAMSLMNLDRNAEYFLEAVATFPEITAYLEDVKSGLIGVQQENDMPGPEVNGEAATIIDGIRRVVGNLDHAHLNEPELQALHGDVQRLVDIARARDIRDEDVSLQRTQVEQWKTRHAEVVAATPAVADALAKLEEQIGGVGMNRGRIGGVLDLLEQWLTRDAEYRKNIEKLKQASSDEDFALVSSLADALEVLKDGCKTLSDEVQRELETQDTEERVTIDGTPRGPGMDGRAQKSPALGSCAEPSEPETMEIDSVSVNLESPDGGDGEIFPSGTSPTEDNLEATARHGDAIADENNNSKADPVLVDSSVRPEGSEDSELNADNADVDSSAHAEDAEDATLQRTEDDIAKALERHRFGLAYHLALATPGVLPSANAVKLAACNYVTNARAPIVAELSEITASLMHEAEPRSGADNEPDHLSWRCHAILTACAALAPALTAPGGPAAQLLSFLTPHLGDLPSLQRLAKTAADVSMKGAHLSIALLQEDDSLEKWRQRVVVLREETRTWFRNERQSKNRFHAATRVWKRMLDDWERNGKLSLGRVLSLLLNEPVESIDKTMIFRTSDYWRSTLEKEIDRIDRENRNNQSKKKIEGAARSDLRNKAGQALAILDRWYSLLSERPDERVAFHKEQAQVLRSTARGTFEAALAEITAAGGSVAEGARDLLRRYRALFESVGNDRFEYNVGVTELLNGDLLADPAIPFDAINRLSDGSDAPFDPDVLRKLTELEQLDFGNAAIERGFRRDFLGAEASIHFAERTRQIEDEDADRARAIVDQQRAQVQQTLEGKIKETSDRLDAAYAGGLLTLEVYEQRRDRLPNVYPFPPNEFARLFEVLEDIDNDLDNDKAQRCDAIRQRLDRRHNLSPHDRCRIRSTINSGQFQIAEDLIERVEHGEELPPQEATSDRPFDRFFPKFVEAYSAFGDEGTHGIRYARNVVEARDTVDLFDASGLSENRARDGVRILDAWVALRGDGRTSTASLSELVKALGFDDAKVRGSDDRTLDREIVFALQGSSIVDRDIVRLPDFGSRADGRYRLFTVRGRGTEETIVREAAKRATIEGPPDIVLFLGVLDSAARRALARDFSSGNYRPTLVLDEALVVFLAVWPGNRLSAFFDCASAFAFSQPFDPDAAQVPPEMFFGRTDARKKIVAMDGDLAHFVYGGRRLGKTALLADIAREYQDKTKTLVSLINLRGSGIGENRRTAVLWEQFAKHLRWGGIIGPKTVRSDSIEEGILAWINKEAGRRILLLVDEADAFLHAEGLTEPRYQVLEQIKRLMERTNRRFKVVFAGLHDVQRAARDSNTPFAHLGEGIRIGPMLPERDKDDIQKLIRIPLEALGYRFASNDLVIRIAAETNYYPALAQQFCKELLRTLREEAGASGKAGPPYSICAETVDRVFSAPETRDRIRNLFSWTIQLDPRYEFLTYLITRKSFDEDAARPQAVPIASIREDALSEWPQGFVSDSSFWMFEVLLDEMVGLGILRELPDKEYAIRTRNLRMLLGTDEEIERRFADAKRSEPPSTYDPAQFRDKLPGGIPSSLTAAQENALLFGDHAVDIIFGTRLAGLDRVRGALELAANRRDGSVPTEPTEPIELCVPPLQRSTLRRISQSRKAGTYFLLVDMTGGWDPATVRAALEFVGQQGAQTRSVRFVFLCGPAEAWRWLKEAPPMKDRVKPREIWLGPCGKYFTRALLMEMESPAGRDEPRDLLWPATVGMLAEDKRLASIDDAIEATFKEDQDNRHVSDILISANTETALRLLSYSPDEQMTADLLSEMSPQWGDSISTQEAMEFFRWADRLGVVCKEGHGYRLDSTYAAGLKRAFSE